MGLPSEEAENYIRADAITRSQYFKNKKYLIVHGSADGMISLSLTSYSNLEQISDNVHLEQSMRLIKELTHEGILYQSQIYPDQSHALLGVGLHLHRSMESFFDECFDLKKLDKFPSGRRKFN